MPQLRQLLQGLEGTHCMGSSSRRVGTQQSTQHSAKQHAQRRRVGTHSQVGGMWCKLMLRREGISPNKLVCMQAALQSACKRGAATCTQVMQL